MKFITSCIFLFGEHEKPHDFQRFTSFGLVKLLNGLTANRRNKSSFAEQVAKTNRLWALEHLKPERLKVSCSGGVGKRKAWASLAANSLTTKRYSFDL